MTSRISMSTLLVIALTAIQLVSIVTANAIGGKKQTLPASAQQQYVSSSTSSTQNAPTTTATASATSREQSTIDLQAAAATTTTNHFQYYQSNNGAIKQRSNNDEHDDIVPLATVNNHSRNNQNLLRPPQYVDVSALVGRNNQTLSSNGSQMFNNNGQSVTQNSLLSAKSRSGLPECATQQVCNAIFVRMNHTQRLCECSSNYNWKCSNNLDPQDGHTIELTRKFDKRIYTQIKTCEPLREVRACKSPTDWTLLALQSERSGKAHYVVVCKCPTWAQLEGPYTHNHPPYANIPGIRVYGMLCAHQTARSSSAQTYAGYNPALNIYPDFPWSEALNVLNTTNLANTLDLGH